MLTVHIHPPGTELPDTSDATFPDSIGDGHHQPNLGVVCSSQVCLQCSAAISSGLNKHMEVWRVPHCTTS